MDNRIVKKHAKEAVIVCFNRQGGRFLTGEMRKALVDAHILFVYRHYPNDFPEHSLKVLNSFYDDMYAEIAELVGGKSFFM